MRSTALCFALLFCLGRTATAAAQTPGPDGPTLLVQRLEAAVAKMDAVALAGLFTADVSAERISLFGASTLLPSVTRAVVRERDRAETPGGYRLMVEMFLVQERQARIATYRLDIVRHAASAPGSGGEWRIANEELLSSVEGLFQLQSNPAKQFAGRNLAVEAVDATSGWSCG
ncbi:MAG: hypothetical protein AB7I50_17650, partial [Vicinamibacterales bacterium]